MSTSLLYHEFGIRGYQQVRTDRGEGMTVFQYRATARQAAVCPPRVGRRDAAGESGSGIAGCLPPDGPAVCQGRRGGQGDRAPPDRGPSFERGSLPGSIASALLEPRRGAESDQDDQVGRLQ